MADRKVSAAAINRRPRRRVPICSWDVSVCVHVADGRMGYIGMVHAQAPFVIDRSSRSDSRKRKQLLATVTPLRSNAMTLLETRRDQMSMPVEIRSYLPMCRLTANLRYDVPDCPGSP